MERMEGVVVAGSHGASVGLFKADVPMTEAVKEYQSPPSSPSTSPTPSPPPAVAGHGGGTPPVWSETAGDDGMQQLGRSERASLSSGRGRGRPRGSGPRQILATLGEWYALSAGGSFTPHVIIVPAGEDVAARIMESSQKGPRSVCILSANGTISNVTLNQPGSSGSNFTYEGQFEILQMTGSFTMSTEGGRRRSGGLSVSLASPDGRVLGGAVAGMLRAASPIQVILGSFLPNSLKQHQRRMGLQQQQPPAAPTLPLQAPPPVLTAALPISQAAPGNGCHAHANGGTGALNLNASSPGFTMMGWPVKPESVGRTPSPDINVCLTPQE